MIAMPRVHKGNRHPQMVRLPIDQYEYYAAEARRLGMACSEYMVYKLALAHGFEPTEQPRNQDQEELSLSKAS